MKAIIVEDSRLARLELKNILKDFTQIELIGECGDPQDAIELLNQKRPELVFMDIQMPGKNGFEVLDALDYEPAVIFTTAYDEYAVRSFEYQPVDYLLKPIEKPRLQQALTKAAKFSSQQEQESLRLEPDSSVFVKDGEQCWMVELKSISHFESCGNYCQVFFNGNKPLIHKSLNQLEQRLPQELFFRANRQHIVNLKMIASVELAVNGNFELKLISGAVVEVSRRHSSRFKSLLSL